MQRLHVPRREGLSLYVPSAHFTHRDSSFREQTVKDPAGHFLQDGLDNLGELPLSDCKKTEGEQQQRNQFGLHFVYRKKRNKKHKMGEWEERGGRKMKREGRGEGGGSFSTCLCLRQLS